MGAHLRENANDLGVDDRIETMKESLSLAILLLVEAKVGNCCHETHSVGFGDRDIPAIWHQIIGCGSDTRFGVGKRQTKIILDVSFVIEQIEEILVQNGVKIDEIVN